jgi:Tfp pilus assembly protein PilN
MIRVNLSGTAKRKIGKATSKSSGPSSMLPVVHLLIMVGTAVAGYLWYSQLNNQSTKLASQITAKEAELADLSKYIKVNSAYDVRLEKTKIRIQTLKDLKKGQVSPVVMLDQLVDSVDKTKFVWLSTFTQTNSTVSMVGTATNLEALATFYSNLEDTGYFHNINVNKFEDSRAGNVAFTLTSEFGKKPAEKGAN